MDKNGVKVTYIETQFVTSDAASFKSLVQRLTGKSPVVAGAGAGPARLLRRPRPCRAGAGADDGRSAAVTGTESYYMSSAGSVSATSTAAANGMRATAPACAEELYGVRDFSELFYVVGGASERRRGGSYNDFPC